MTTLLPETVQRDRCSHGRARGAGPALVVLVAVLALAACEVRAETLVDVAPDGSGVVTLTVTLDAEAARQLGDPARIDTVRIDTEDLGPGGWDVAAPIATPEGGLQVVATRAFSSPQEVPVLLDQVAGPGVLVEGASLEVDSSQLATDYRWRSVLRSTGDPAVLSDPELAALLDGLPLGRSVEELAALGADRPDAAVASLVVRLPGGVEESGSVPLTGGQSQSVEVAADSSVLSPVRLLGLLAVAALFVAAVVVAARSRR